MPSQPTPYASTNVRPLRYRTEITQPLGKKTLSRDAGTDVSGSPGRICMDCRRVEIAARAGPRKPRSSVLGDCLKEESRFCRRGKTAGNPS